MAVLIAAMALLVAGCGDDDDDDGQSGGEVAATEPASNDDGDSGASGDGDAAPVEPTEPAGGEATGSGGDGASGNVVLGSEVINFDSSRCFLQEQDAAAGGGKILFVVQAFGTNAGGEEVALDVSRFDEDSQFSGDVVSVVVGDPFSDSAIDFDANGDIGTVTVDGQFVHASELTFVNLSDAGDSQPGSFEVNC